MEKQQIFVLFDHEKLWVNTQVRMKTLLNALSVFVKPFPSKSIYVKKAFLGEKTVKHLAKSSKIKTCV